MSILAGKDIPVAANTASVRPVHYPQCIHGLSVLDTCRKCEKGTYR